MGRAFTSAALQGKMEPQEQGGKRSTDSIINKKNNNKDSENLSHFWKQLEQPSDKQLH